MTPVSPSISVKTEMNVDSGLDKVHQRFVLHWGEMGARWGVNRTVAQVHALLLLAPRPLHAEEIASLLGVARSNVSTSLRELQAWGIVRLVHVMGDRRDHFEGLQDTWELFRTIAVERKRREMDPTLAVLRECIAEAEGARKRDPHVEGRLRELLGFFEATTGWFDRLRALPVPALARLASMGDRALKLLGVGGSDEGAEGKGGRKA